jgi:hypothetical protein
VKVIALARPRLTGGVLRAGCSKKGGANWPGSDRPIRAAPLTYHYDWGTISAGSFFRIDAFPRQCERADVLSPPDVRIWTGAARLDMRVVDGPRNWQ